MDRCRKAIPVWIMPRYLVAEMVEPAPGHYDTVIVDEASQLGIESLFLFFIAKKMVVVGDDQQISPYGIGIKDDAIAALQKLYLEDIPHRHALSPQSSLYANAKIRFGENIVLREHFRCMPEIIQFSNDLCYAINGTPLDPLRAYSANRLLPIVVRHVPTGCRTGGKGHVVNEPEADAVVAQIIACLKDPRYGRDRPGVVKTMGVISLQGETQAKLIERKLLDHIEPEVIEERRLICGDAYTFQGDERHTIFLSMVAAPNERIGTFSGFSARQRFNVAASRAQDQLWLFHTATLDDLSPRCMRYRLLKYMLAPERDVTFADEQNFDSQFERYVFDILSSRGYHVRTQVCVGDPTNHRYRIDLVVEGMQGRLAVECDGDEWHGPDRYEQDMARQRDLERAGWQFVRIPGGDFYRDREQAMEPVWTELERLGIRPGGIDQSAAPPPEPAIVALTPLAADLSDPADEMIDEVDTAEPQPTSTETKTVEVAPPTATRPSPYIQYDGTGCDDPRTGTTSTIAEGLANIVNAEGPMFARHAYDIYRQSCEISRMDKKLKKKMNKAMQCAIDQGLVVKEDELNKGGLLHCIMRSRGVPPIRFRERGPRQIDEIPPSELRVAALITKSTTRFPSASDEHLRAVLDFYGLSRLTNNARRTIEKCLTLELQSVDDFFRDLAE